MLWKLHVGILNALEEWLLFSLIEFLSPLCIDGIAHQLEQLSAMHFSNTKDSKFIRLMDLFSPVYHKRKSQFASSSRWKITNNGEVDYPTLTFWVEYTLHSIPNFTRRKWLFPPKTLKHTFERDLVLWLLNSNCMPHIVSPQRWWQMKFFAPTQLASMIYFKCFSRGRGIDGSYLLRKECSYHLLKPQWQSKFYISSEWRLTHSIAFEL